MSNDFSSRDPILEGVDSIIAQRYSPRAYRAGEVSDTTINVLFDAARQAPSCFNEQPWRFYCSTPSSHDRFVAMLVPANAEWAASASRLVIVTTNTKFARNGKPNAHSWFDTGAAWYSMAYQARSMGLHTHAMAGINKDIIREELALPEDEDIICAVAIGYVDETADEDISPRKSLDEILTLVS